VGELKSLILQRGHKISTRDGSGIDFSFNSRFQSLGSLSTLWILFENKSKKPSHVGIRQKSGLSPPIYPLPAVLPTPPLVYPVVLLFLARYCGGTGDLNLNFKLCHYSTFSVILFSPT
jgi:hypothetical protein